MSRLRWLACAQHTDGAYDEVPFKATQLYALEIPSRGGDTLFSSAYAAYEALPPRLRQQLEGRRGAFTFGGKAALQGKPSSLLNPEDQGKAPALHPLLRRHKDSGRTALYFDPNKIVHIEGLPQQESDRCALHCSSHSCCCC